MSIAEKLKFKISVLGDPSVGKTSLIHHFCEGFFRESYLATIGVAFLTKNLEIDLSEGKRAQVTLQIWDVGGQSIFSRIRTKYIKGSQGCLCVWDVTNKNSLSHIDAWVEELMQSINITNLQSYPLIIIGNKIDLNYDKRLVERAEQYLQNQFNIKIPTAFTSAKTGVGMNEAFKQITKLMINKIGRK
ncbi:MAG: Rab family GTPase [Promethearchaeota archaeon]